MYSQSRASWVRVRWCTYKHGGNEVSDDESHTDVNRDVMRAFGRHAEVEEEDAHFDGTGLCQ